MPFLPLTISYHSRYSRTSLVLFMFWCCTITSLASNQLLTTLRWWHMCCLFLFPRSRIHFLPCMPLMPLSLPCHSNLLWHTSFSREQYMLSFSYPHTLLDFNQAWTARRSSWAVPYCFWCCSNVFYVGLLLIMPISLHCSRTYYPLG